MARNQKRTRGNINKPKLEKNIYMRKKIKSYRKRKQHGGKKIIQKTNRSG